MKAVGLDIGEHYLRVSIISTTFGLKKSLRLEEMSLPESTAERNNLIRESLLRWKNDFGIKGVVIGLDLREFLHSFVQLPPLKSKEDIRNALAFEIEKYLPLPPEEYIFDFHTIETTKEITKNLVLSIKKERLEWIGECLKDTGLTLIGVRCSFIEALNEFISTDKKKGDAIFLYPARHAFHIARLKDLNLKSVEEKALIEELEVARGAPIYMAGAGSIPLEGINLKSLPFSIPNIIALSAFKRRTIALNFMPEELVISRQDYYPYTISLIGIFSALIFIATTISAYYKDRRALDEVESRISEIKTTARGLVEDKKELEEIEKREDFLLDFQSKAFTGIRVQRELTIVMPEGAWLTELSVEGTKVEIKGFAKKASGLIEPMEKSALFKKVEFSSAITKKDDMERFSLKMEIEE